MAGEKHDVLSEYNTLKDHRACLDEMVMELDYKLREFQRRADENTDKPVTVRNCQIAAERVRKRLEALKAVLPLVDMELLYFLQVLK